MKPVYHLYSWALVCNYESPYLAPEQCTKHLTGHRDKSGGKIVTTSQIIKANGHLIETRNSIYLLESPHPAYVKWCKDNNILFDIYDPIKIRR